VALAESENVAVAPPSAAARLIARVKAILGERSDSRLAQLFAGKVFLVRVASALLALASQVLLARWMGSFEFGIYIYVWTWVLMIGALSDAGLSSAARRFIPEYTGIKSFDLLRGFLSGSRWLAFGVATAGVLTHVNSALGRGGGHGADTRLVRANLWAVAGAFVAPLVLAWAAEPGSVGWAAGLIVPVPILAVIAVLNAAAAAFYYLRVVVYMFMREPRGEPAPIFLGRLMRSGLIVAAVLTVVLGLVPGLLLPIVGNAARALTL